MLWLADPVAWFSGGHRQTMRFFLTQADSLKPGTPVRLMGVDIGVVSKVQLLTASTGDNRVMVEIKTQEDAPELPPETRATVQFYGLAGGKSIDLLVDRPKDGQPFESTLRMRDFQRTQNDLALALIQGSNATTRVLTSSQTLADPHGALSRLNHSLTRWTGTATLAQWQVEAARGKLPNLLTQWHAVVDDIQKVAVVSGQVTNPATVGPGLQALSRYTEVGILESRTALEHYNAGALALSEPLHRLSAFLHAQAQENGQLAGKCRPPTKHWPTPEAFTQANLILGQLADDLAARREAGKPACQNDWKRSWQQFNDALIKANGKF